MRAASPGNGARAPHRRAVNRPVSGVCGREIRRFLGDSTGRRSGSNDCKKHGSGVFKPRLLPRRRSACVCVPCAMPPRLAGCAGEALFCCTPPFGALLYAGRLFQPQRFTSWRCWARDFAGSARQSAAGSAPGCPIRPVPFPCPVFPPGSPLPNRPRTGVRPCGRGCAPNRKIRRVWAIPKENKKKQFHRLQKAKPPQKSGEPGFRPRSPRVILAVTRTTARPGSEGHAAVDNQVCAGHEGIAAAGRKEDRLRNLVRRTQPADWLAALVHLVLRLGVRRRLDPPL